MRRLVILAAVLVGCQTPGFVDRPPEETVELTAVPFFAQDTDQCGPAALAMVLGNAGRTITLESARAAVYLPARGGSVQPEMVAAIRAHGLIALATDPRLDVIYDELRAGRPVLVFQNLGFSAVPIWHYAVVVGYDASADAWILRSGTRRRLEMPTPRFARTWARGDYWARAVLEPGVIPDWAAPQGYLLAAAELEQLGQTGAALRAYRAATERWPGQPAAWLGVGNVRYAEGDLAAARTAYGQALAANPRDLAARNNLAHVMGEAGCPQAALALLDAAPAGSAASDFLSETRADVLKMPRRPGACDEDPAD